MKGMYLIIGIIQKSFTELVVDEIMRAGAEGVTMSDAKGTGVRQRLGELGEFIEAEKMVIQVIVSKKQKDNVFRALKTSASLDKPGRGIAYMQKLEEVAGFLQD